MGKKRKLGETSVPEEREELRSETEDETHKEKLREKKRRKKDESSNVGKLCFDLPGQIHETPNERDPYRIFLESLYQQLPDDELVGRWMIEWGLLPREEATKVLEKIVNEKDVVSGGVVKAKAKLKKKKVRL